MGRLEILIQSIRRSVRPGEVKSAIAYHDDWCAVETEGDGIGCTCDPDIAIFDGIVDNHGKEIFIFDNRPETEHLNLN